MMRKLLFLITILLNCGAAAHNRPIRFQHLNAKDGLSQGHVLCMMQDSEGYVWAGTYLGLNRYNGYSFDIFYADNNNPGSLFINVVYSLFEDKDGKIWCGTWGVDIYDKKSETFEHIPANEGNNSLSAGEILAIQQDKKGNMWFGTQTAGINKLELPSRKMTYYRADINNKKSLQSDHINDILISKDEFLWIATEDGGLSKMNLKDETITTYLHSGNDIKSLSSNKISCIYEDSNGNIWAGDASTNLCLYHAKDENFTCFEILPKNSDMYRARIMDIAQDNHGNLLIATNGSGLILFDCKNKSSEIYLHNNEDNETIASNETYSLLVDKTNTVFIGTYGRGISKYSPYNQKFDVYSFPESANLGSDANSFTDAIEDGKGNLIAGTYNGFVVFNLSSGTYTHYLPGNTYEENKILTLKQGPDGSVWMSSLRKLYQYDEYFNKVGTYILVDNLKDHSIYSIEFDHKNNLWIALFTKGLLRIDEAEWKNKKAEKLKYTLYLRNDTIENSISGNQQWIIFHDADSNLWIGGVGGIDKYNYDEDNFTRVFYPGTVKTLDFDSKGKLWMGTIGNGLFSFDINNGNFKRYTVKDGLSHSFIYGIVIDSYDNIWISSEKGLSRFNIETEKFRNYDERDGLPTDHFDDKSESRLSDNRIYMGTNNGFIIFDPEKIVDDTSRCKVVLTSLKINNRPIDFYSDKVKDTTMNIPISQLSRIELKPAQRDVTFEFAALHFAAPHKIQYKYLLKGYDEEWIHTNADNRSAKYTNLDGGIYTFMVKATNSDGTWTESPLEITVAVIPPFYQTLWFKILIVLFLIVSASWIFRARTNREKMQREKLEKLVGQRTIEITNKTKLLRKTADDLKRLNELLLERQQRIEEQSEKLAEQRDELSTLNKTKDKLFSVIAHDLKNPFSVIIGYTELLIMKFDQWDDKKKLYFLTLLKESSDSAYVLLENLLQWSRSQSGNINFDPFPIKVTEIFDMVMPGILDFAKKKQISIKTQVHEKDLKVQADTNMLSVILRNLLFNAVKFSKKNDKVILSAELYDPEFALFTIKDQGIGMSKKNLDTIFQLDKSKSTKGTGGEQGTGLGLILCKDFIDAHHGKIWVESTPDKGTTFYFTIPLTK